MHVWWPNWPGWIDWMVGWLDDYNWLIIHFISSSKNIGQKHQFVGTVTPGQRLFLRQQNKKKIDRQNNNNNDE